jgi:formate hydrogenlyase subunit 3/multisubunit Na+/H+ antiporter MnhD subunit
MIAVPLGVSPFVYLAGRLGSHKVELNGRSPLVRGLALLTMLATWVLFALSWMEFTSQKATLLFHLDAIWLSADGVSFLLSAMVLSLGTFVVLFSGPYIAGEVGEEKYYAMLLAIVGIMVGLGSARDLFNLWMWFEAMAVSSYLLVAFYREHPTSLEAGMKYLVQSAVGSVLVLLGIALVLGNVGTLDMDQIRSAVVSAASAPLALLLAGALFVIGFGVKVAFVPLHTWLPDAHSQAPSGISAMLSGVVIEAGLIAMLRALSTLGGFSISWGALLLAFGALNMFFGNLMALRQTQIKRMLAYSSLSHIGYILIGLGIALFNGSPAGAQGAAFHLFNHMIMKGLAFLAVGALMFALLDQNGVHRPLEVKDLAGAARKWLMGLVIFAAMNSVLSLAYYAPIVNMLYRRNMGDVVQGGARIPVAMSIPLVIFGLAIVLIGLVPSLMNWLTEPAAQALLAMFGK